MCLRNIWTVPKVQVYLWLGSIKHKKNYPSGLPPGFQPTNELQNAERPAVPPPPIIHYSEKHVSMILWDIWDFWWFFAILATFWHFLVIFGHDILTVYNKKKYPLGLSLGFQPTNELQNAGGFAVFCHFGYFLVIFGQFWERLSSFNQQMICKMLKNPQ